MIQNVHSLQAWRDFLQISVNAGLIAAEALFLKWSLCDMRGDKRKLIESWVDIAGLNLAGLWLQEYRLLLSPLLYTRYLCVFLIVNVYEDSPRKKIQSGCCFQKTQTETNCFILTRFMALLQNSSGECSLSAIHQSEWLSLDWLPFPLRNYPWKSFRISIGLSGWKRMKTQLCVLIQSFMCLLPIPAFVEILMSVFGQGGRSFWIFRHLPSTKWQTIVQRVQGSWYPGVIPVFLGLLAHIPVYLEHLPTQPLLTPAILSMSYRLCFSGLERLLPPPVFMLALALSSSQLLFIGG